MSHTERSRRKTQPSKRLQDYVGVPAQGGDVTAEFELNWIDKEQQKSEPEDTQPCSDQLAGKRALSSKRTAPVRSVQAAPARVGPAPRGAMPIASEEELDALYEAFDQDAADELVDEEAEDLADRLRDKATMPIGTRPMTSAELRQLEQDVRGLVGATTSAKYQPYIDAFKWWCTKNGCNYDLSRLADVVKATRFVTWYVEGADGHPQDWGIQGRAADGRLSPNTAMVLHSALVLWSKMCVVCRGSVTFSLTDDPAYSIVYRKVTKGRSTRGTGSASGVVSYDDFVRMMSGLVASTDAKDATVHCAIAHQTGVCGRGDEVRPVRYSTWRMRLCSSIGPVPGFYVYYTLVDHKKRKGVPVQKHLLRHCVPELCAVASHARMLHQRFKLQGEVFPMPGSDKLENFFCFTGSNRGTPISYRRHNEMVAAVFKRFGIVVDKNTHTFRKLAAQIATSCGIPIELLQRVGDWLMDCLGTAYADVGAAAEALLALAGWILTPNLKDAYYAPRMRAAVPEQLIDDMLPPLRRFEEAAAAAKAAAAAGSKEEQLRAEEAVLIGTTLRFIMRCGIQDAYAIADKYPQNPFFADLLNNPTFVECKTAFQAFQSLGGFDQERPPANQLELLQRVKAMIIDANDAVEQRLLTAIGAGGSAAGLPTGSAAAAAVLPPAAGLGGAEVARVPAVGQEAAVGEPAARSGGAAAAVPPAAGQGAAVGEPLLLATSTGAAAPTAGAAGATAGMRDSTVGLPMPLAATVDSPLLPLVAVGAYNGHIGMTAGALDELTACTPGAGGELETEDDGALVPFGQPQPLQSSQQLQPAVSSSAAAEPLITYTVQPPTDGAPMFYSPSGATRTKATLNERGVGAMHQGCFTGDFLHPGHPAVQRLVGQQDQQQAPLLAQQQQQHQQQLHHLHQAPQPQQLVAPQQQAQQMLQYQQILQQQQQMMGTSGDEFTASLQPFIYSQGVMGGSSGSGCAVGSGAASAPAQMMAFVQLAAQLAAQAAAQQVVQRLGGAAMGAPPPSSSPTTQLQVQGHAGEQQQQQQQQPRLQAGPQARAILGLGKCRTIVEVVEWYTTAPSGYTRTRQQLEEGEPQDVSWRLPHKKWKQRFSEVSVIIQAVWKEQQQISAGLARRREVALAEAAASLDAKLGLPPRDSNGMTVSKFSKRYKGDIYAALASLAAGSTGCHGQGPIVGNSSGDGSNKGRGEGNSSSGGSDGKAQRPTQRRRPS